MTKIGIIGTGMLGNAVGLHLLESGYELTVYNRTKSKTTELASHGATIVGTPKEVAQKTELVITIVKDADAVKSVSFEENGIVEGKHDGLIVADMSTINPLASKEIAKQFKENGITMARRKRSPSPSGRAAHRHRVASVAVAAARESPPLPQPTDPTRARSCRPPDRTWRSQE